MSLLFSAVVTSSLVSLQHLRASLNLNQIPAQPDLWHQFSVQQQQSVWTLCVCVVRRCALTRGDPWGSRTQSFGLVRHPQPERQQFTRPSFSPRNWSKLSSACMVQQLQAPLRSKHSRQKYISFLSRNLKECYIIRVIVQKVKLL